MVITYAVISYVDMILLSDQNCI